MTLTIALFISNRVNFRLMKACKDPIRLQCKPEAKDKFHGNLLGCLERNKKNLKGQWNPVYAYIVHAGWENLISYCNNLMLEIIRLIKIITTTCYAIQWIM